MKEMRYDLNLIRNKLRTASNKELSDDAEMLTDEFIKVDKKYKMALGAGLMSAIACLSGGMFYFFSFNPIIKCVGLGVQILSLASQIVLNNKERKYKVQRNEIGETIEDILTELHERMGESTLISEDIEIFPDIFGDGNHSENYEMEVNL